MAFTRFHDDPFRIEKQLQESTDKGRYMLNVPGNGVNMPVVTDPYIRMQKWGGNRMTNFVNLESDLMGLNKKLSKDCKGKDEYDFNSIKSSKINYPVNDSTITEQPRATNPAWTARDLEQPNWQILHYNPQEHACINFTTNTSTRIIEKDNFVTYPRNEFLN